MRMSYCLPRWISMGGATRSPNSAQAADRWQHPPKISRTYRGGPWQGATCTAGLGGRGLTSQLLLEPSLARWPAGVPARVPQRPRREKRCSRSAKVQGNCRHCPNLPRKTCSRPGGGGRLLAQLAISTWERRASFPCTEPKEGRPRSSNRAARGRRAGMRHRRTPSRRLAGPDWRRPGGTSCR